MKKEILILTVLISNIAFASALPLEVREAIEITTKKNRVVSLYSTASDHLYKRGLDKNVAKQKVLDSLKGDEYINDLMAQNIIENFNDIKFEDIISYIGDSALHGKSVDLSSYANIINLFQKNNGLALDTLILEKIEKISLENKSIKLLYRVWEKKRLFRFEI